MKCQALGIVVLCAFFSATYGSEKLQYLFNADSNIFAGPRNLSTQQVGILDAPSGISALYNGKTGAAFAFCYESKTGVYIPPGVNNETWYCSKKSYEEYFSKLPPQKTLYNLGIQKGITFNASTITGEIAEEIAEIVGSLSIEYSSTSVAFSAFLDVSKRTSDFMKGPLEGFSKILGNINCKIRGSFKWIVEVFQGFGIFFSSVKGGIRYLIEQKYALDFKKIASAPTAFHILVVLLESWPLAVDVERNLGGVLNCPEKFWKLLDKLSGELTYGFDGFINVIYDIFKFVNGETTLKDVVEVLTQYSEDCRTDFRAVRKLWKLSITKLLETLEKKQCLNKLKNLEKLLKQLLQKSWFVNKVNMSAIIELLLNIDRDEIQGVACILKLLEAVPHHHQ